MGCRLAAHDYWKLDLVVVHFLYVDLLFLGLTKQVLAEEVSHLPEEVLVHGVEAVALAWENHSLETLVGAYEGVNHACGVGRVYVVVHITCNQHEVTLETACELLICADVVRECGVALNDTVLTGLLLYVLLDTMVLLAPPVVVDAVVVVSGT